MDSKKRNKNLIFKVNEDEWNIIQKRLKICKVSSMSELFRHMMLNGIYLEYDHEKLKKIRQSVMSAANNINQIAHRVNSTSRIYKQEFFELQEDMNKIWNELYGIQTELKKLNPSNLQQKKNILNFLIAYSIVVYVSMKSATESQKKPLLDNSCQRNGEVPQYHPTLRSVKNLTAEKKSPRKRLWRFRGLAVMLSSIWVCEDCGMLHNSDERNGSAPIDYRYS